MSTEIIDKKKCWYALRDLKRSNAVFPAYKQLRELGIEVFTPMKWRVTKKNGKQIGREVPVMPDLLFAHDTRETLDPIIAQTPTLQYRFKRGGAYCEPIIVPEDDMNRFIGAVQAAEEPKYYSVEEIGTVMKGKRIRVVGGPMNGYEGKLLSVRGSKVKRIVIELPNLLAVSVKVDDECIQVID